MLNRATRLPVNDRRRARMARTFAGNVAESYHAAVALVVNQTQRLLLDEKVLVVVRIEEPGSFLAPGHRGHRLFEAHTGL